MLVLRHVGDEIGSGVESDSLESVHGQYSSVLFSTGVRNRKPVPDGHVVIMRERSWDIRIALQLQGKSKYAEHRDRY